MMRFVFPRIMESTFREIIAGEYQIPLEIEKPVICDVGANIGAFAVWAMRRWPDCTIHCYEPSPYNFGLLKENLGQIPNIKINNVAIGDPKHTKLFKGKINCGQSSFFQMGFQQEDYEMVTTILPSELPQNCDILKIDTEGCEVEILNGLKDRTFKAVILEYHSIPDRRRIEKLLKNYRLIEHRVTFPNCGVLKFLHK